jgi:hypothetical protein
MPLLFLITRGFLNEWCGVVWCGVAVWSGRYWWWPILVSVSVSVSSGDVGDRETRENKNLSPRRSANQPPFFPPLTIATKKLFQCFQKAKTTYTEYGVQKNIS